MSDRNAQQLTRNAMRALLAHYRITPGDTAPEDVVTEWLRELRGRSVGECHAALSSLPLNRVQHVTAGEVARLITLARSRPAATGTPSSARPPRPRDRAADKAAGARGIGTVYELMGWTGHEKHALARTVPCPFCRASAGVPCSPLTRNRLRQREIRDRETRMHPSRLRAAEERKRANSTSSGAAASGTTQGASA
ncbi:hypothetical protein UK23_10620 [Lentzea aerocolonigenes]|uniref:DNA-binding phage zinc finger domain-containing protein n=1 Tax=Lentzea aerocolonigenes TaxID=68170 RepID=A0A0F0H6H1_LENAE|nr:hypothetical protein [Lentzea aerocolonigenes]KJK50441.1 hypothetical protein UK23_10620 [Lentzea aerocolonigenes]